MGTACIAAILLAGWLIGVTGIGGVLVVPALTQLAGVPAPQAVAASTAAFAFPAAVALGFLLARRAYVPGMVLLMIGALPGAAFGALLVHAYEGRVLLAFVTALLVFAGIQALRGPPLRNSTPFIGYELSRSSMLTIGAVVGVGSALTGTGGPVLLSPLLVLLRQPLPAVISNANAIQMPIAIAAAAVHLHSGALDLGLTATIGITLLVASFAGQIAAARMHARRLQRLLAVMLLAVAAWLAWTLIY